MTSAVARRWARVRTPLPLAGGRRALKSRLARQVAVLGFVFCTVALLVAVPLRSYLAQNASLAQNKVSEQQLFDQLAGLQREKAALSDPAYIKQEARRKLQYVDPGDTVYQVNVPALPAAPVNNPRPVVAPTPWYANLWSTLSDPAGASTGK